MVWVLMMKINYKELCDFYQDIIWKIFNCLNKDSPAVYDKENHNLKYSEEYLHAYGYLQRAEWRLSDTEEMKKYWNEDDFVHFGLENLSNVRSRIEHYLKDTSFKFPECVYEYDKYDDIVKKYYSPLRYDDYHDERFTYYMNLHYHEGQIKHINFLIKTFERDIQKLSKFMSNQNILDSLNYNDLEGVIDLLEESKYQLSNTLLKTYEFEESLK